MSDLAATLAAWRPDPAAEGALFSADEIQRLDAARRAIDSARRRVAYCVFENPYARAGGIFAVATHLPPHLRAAGDEVVLVTPFHRNLATTPAYHDLEFIGEIDVPFSGHPVRAELFQRYDGLGNRWVYMQSWAIFDADGGPDRKNPYGYPISWLILRDGLFASKAVPYVLAHLGMRDNVVVHAQDWQFAPTALTVKEALLDGVLDSAAVVLTSHNPYDHPLPDANLSWITRRVGLHRWPLGHETVYQRMIPLTDAPLSTVSRTFARELTEDPLQTEHFARHLQRVYRAHGIVGVDNPLFGEPRPAFSEAAVEAARVGRTTPIQEEKLTKRETMLATLADYRDPRILGGLDGGGGRPLTELPPETPVFLMFGRLDPGQKGFDLLCRAIEGFRRDEAKFILTPNVGGDAGPWLDDLRRVAEQRAGDVAVYPFRVERGFLEAMAGATYAVMPSLYEPFGAATEAYLAGTPVIARATGGLVDQVDDYGADAGRATGFLFREKLPLGASWPAIQNAATPAERVGVHLYAMMAEALYDALQKGANLWRRHRPAYARMLTNLYPKAASFSGERAAAGYRALYETAARAR